MQELGQKIDDNHPSNLIISDHLYAKSEKKRMAAFDIQRGLIVVLMAFSHSREYLGADYYSNSYPGISPVWKGHAWIDVFYQLFVRLVAGGFFMTMGIGIYFLWQSRLKAGKTPSQIAQYLFSRGILLILLQMTVLELFQYVSEGYFFINAGVLMSLGFCMIGAAGCLWLIDVLQSKKYAKLIRFDIILPLALLLSLILINQLWMYHIDIKNPDFLQMLLLVGGEYTTRFNLELHINFTPLPWFTGTVFGLIIGRILFTQGQQGMKILQKIIFCLLITWLILRTGFLFNWITFGDYKFPAPGESISLMTYFCMTKYPPSLDYYLWVLAVNLQGIVWWNKLEVSSSRYLALLKPLNTFGQCALFFFVCHWYVYYGLSLFLNEKLSTPLEVFSGWIVGLIILYPICKAFRRFKMSKPADSLWRML